MKRDEILDALFEIVDEHEVYEFAKTYAYTNDTFAKLLKKRFQKHLPSEDKAPKKDEILKAIERCFDNEIEYPSYGRYNSWEPEFQNWFAVGRDIQRVQRQLKMLVDSGHEALALDLALTLLEKGGKEYEEEWNCGNEDLDWEDLHIDETLAIIRSAFASGKIAAKRQLEVCQQLEQMERMEAYDNSDFNDIIEETRERLLTDDERIDIRRKAFQTAVGDYSRESAAKELWDYLIRLGRDEEAVAFYKKNSKIHDLRTKYVGWLVEKGKLPDAIKELDEGLVKITDEPGQRISWEQYKMEIYEKMGDREHVISQAEWLFLHGNDTMAYYKKLKGLIPVGEWSETLRSLLSKRNTIHTSTLAEIYDKEKWFDDLYKLMMGDFYDLLPYLNRYAKHLSVEQQKDVVGRMEPILRKMAENQMGRDRYRELTEKLNTLGKCCPPGRALATQLVADFRVKYRNRPAMLDELSKFK